MLSSSKGLVDPKRSKRQISGPLQLPAEVLERIFTKLSPPDIFQCLQVSRHWNETLQDPWIWRRLLIVNFGIKKFPSTLKLSSYREDFKNMCIFKYGKPVKTLQKDAKVQSVAFSNSGRFLVCCTEDVLSAWDVEDNFALLHRSRRAGRKGMGLDSIVEATFSETDDMVLVVGCKPMRDLGDDTGPQPPKVLKVFSFPQFSPIWSMCFERPPFDDVQSVIWFGLKSFLVRLTLQNGGRRIPPITHLSYIFSTSSGTKNLPKMIERPSEGCFENVGVVDNTTTGRKHVVMQWRPLQEDEVGSAGYLRTFAISGNAHDPLHSCHRCTNSPDSCVLADYSSDNVLTFEKVQETYRKVEMRHWIVIDLVTGNGVDNKFFATIKIGSSCAVLSEFTLGLEMVRNVVFPDSNWLGLRYGWVKLAEAGRLLTRNNKQKSSSLYMYDPHYKVFVKKRHLHELKKETTAVQPGKGRFMVVNCNGNLNCYLDTI